jgi:carbon monoxide dehydrogenase subunit G
VATVIREFAIAAPAAQCWDALRDFGAVDRRLAAGFVTGTKMLNERDREVTFFTGAVARERLVGIDDDRMRLAYSVVQSAMGSTHHNASAQILPEGAEGSRFVWITDVLPDELSDRIGALMDAGLKAMKATLERAATPA